MHCEGGGGRGGAENEMGYDISAVALGNIIYGVRTRAVKYEKKEKKSKIKEFFSKAFYQK